MEAPLCFASGCCVRGMGVRGREEEKVKTKRQEPLQEMSGRRLCLEVDDFGTVKSNNALREIGAPQDMVVCP